MFSERVFFGNTLFFPSQIERILMLKNQSDFLDSGEFSNQIAILSPLDILKDFVFFVEMKEKESKDKYKSNIPIRCLIENYILSEHAKNINYVF